MRKRKRGDPLSLLNSKNRTARKGVHPCKKLKNNKIYF
ncbi:hypothetical protein B4100_2774 [Heyndrickxia coagulans]|nr:hypothetical protein B4100_2774 [Heyndrickxia coagulans]